MTNKKNENTLPESSGDSLPASTLASQEGDISSIPPIPITPKKGMTKEKANKPEKGLLPEPFTPSINRTLRGETSNGQVSKVSIPSLPEGLSVSALKNRLNGKKVAKGAFLTPKEMEELTAPWRPYRSIAVYYMWALAEESNASK